MRQTLRHNQQRTPLVQRQRSLRLMLRAHLSLLIALVLGAVLIVVLYQIPASHPVDIGGYDAAYVRGFHDPEYVTPTTVSPAYLAGSNGQARWSRTQSVLLFPQAGLPGSITLRLRGWRTDGPSPQVSVLLNGDTLLGTIQTGDAWEEHRFPITGGLLKATDIFIEIRTETTTLPNDERAVGVLLDSATYKVGSGANGFITPYPSQVAYGALAAGLVWLLWADLPWRRRTGRDEHASATQTRSIRRPWPLWAGGIAISLAFLLLYRLQPPLYPYPLRWLLPMVNLALITALTLRHGPALVARRPALIDAIALGSIGVWTGAVLLAARNHVTLSRPGVENDFGVFADRSAQLTEIFRADGFYNLGYPLLLWLVRPLTADNPFLAGRLVAAISGTVLLLASYWIARTVIRPATQHARFGPLLTVVLLTLSPLIVQYALYVGSDMPFAALVTLTIALLISRRTYAADEQAEPVSRSTASRRTIVIIALAGFVAGCTFLVRHLGLFLLPWGMLFCVILTLTAQRERRTEKQHWLTAHGLLPAIFCLGFLLAALPQLVVNTLETGQPLYNQQAKNVWLAVYGNTDWGRWDEAPNDISMAEIVLRDPVRFFDNWWHNLVGFVGSGAEDTSEFGRAIQLRLLGWPANWIAIIGLLFWLANGRLVLNDWRLLLRRYLVPTSLLSLIVLFVLVASMAFMLPRFVLPLAPLYAVAAAWLVVQIMTVGISYTPNERQPIQTDTQSAGWRSLAATLLLLALLWGGFGTGTRYVLDNQPTDEIAAIRLLQTTLQPNEQVLAHVPADGKIAQYSAVAHQMVPWRNRSDAAPTNEQADYLLWHTSFGPPPTTTPDAVRVGEAGGYGLYQLAGP